MKLRNRKTGEIIDDGYVRETHDFQFDGQKHVLAVFKGNGHRPPERVSGAYKSLAELNAEWEDAPEEPKEYWYLENNGDVVKTTYEGNLYEEKMQEIGNYFETKEEAEKAVEKLKAWKRLRDVGFKLKGWYMPKNTLNIEIDGGFPKDVSLCDVMDDLDIVFGGEDGN